MASTGKRRTRSEAAAGGQPAPSPIAVNIARLAIATGTIHEVVRLLTGAAHDDRDETDLASPGRDATLATATTAGPWQEDTWHGEEKVPECSDPTESSTEEECSIELSRLITQVSERRTSRPARGRRSSS